MWVWNSLWPNYNSHFAFWCWKFRGRGAEQKVCRMHRGHLCLSEQRRADKGCRQQDHFTFKPVFNSPNSTKIARAQSLAPRINRPPKFSLVVAGKVKEQQSLWELFLKNIYFCNGFIALTSKPQYNTVFPLCLVQGTITFDGIKEAPQTNSLVPNKLCPGSLWASAVEFSSRLGQSCPAPSLGHSCRVVHYLKAPNNEDVVF